MSDQKNKLIDIAVVGRKTHSDALDFRKIKYENHTGYDRTIELSFLDPVANNDFGHHKIEWNITQTDIEYPETMSARLLLDRERIRGIDYNKAPINYKFDVSKTKPIGFHENVISLNRDGLTVNTHISLTDWTLYDNIYNFATSTAERWNIDTWREKNESADLFEYSAKNKIAGKKHKKRPA
ncbi:MAG: hypothetical protein WCS96_00840 [Victivallales bacterium]|jgi:hypothetical protein